MYRQNHDKGTGFALGMMSGAIVGAGLALLFAPKAGRQLRSDIAGSVDGLRDAIAERYASLAESAGVELSDLHETIDSAADAVESRAKSAVQSAARKVRQATGAAV